MPNPLRLRLPCDGRGFFSLFSNRVLLRQQNHGKTNDNEQSKKLKSVEYSGK